MGASIKERKLRDIEAVHFGEEIQEVVSSLEILLMLFEIDDDQEIIAACKRRLQEGVQKLKDLGYGSGEKFKIN